MAGPTQMLFLSQIVLLASLHQIVDLTYCDFRPVNVRDPILGEI